MFIKYNKETGEIIGQVGFMNSNDPDVVGIDEKTWKTFVKPKYIDGKFIEFELTLQEIEKLIKSISTQIDIELSDRMQAPLVYNGITFQCDIEKSMRNLSSTLNLAANEVLIPDPIGWQDINNVIQQVNIANLKSVAAAVSARGQQLYLQAWALKDILNTLTQKELLTHIVSMRNGQQPNLNI